MHLRPTAPTPFQLLAFAALAALSGCQSDLDLPSRNGSGGGGALPELVAGPLSVLTWNIENYPLSAMTEARVVETINARLPDLVGVQEIADPTAFTALDVALPGYSVLINDDPEAFQRIGLLYRPERVRVTEVETVFSQNRTLFPRPPLKAFVTTLLPDGSTFDFTLLVVHLKAGSDFESADRRQLANDHLDGWVRGRISTGSDLDHIIIGDFNDELTDLPQHNVFEAFLDAPGDYRFLTQPLEASGGRTYVPFDSFLDHILVTTSTDSERGAGAAMVIDLTTVYGDYRSTVSDHLPVSATFVGTAD